MTTLCQQDDKYLKNIQYFYCASTMICHVIVSVHQQKRTFFTMKRYNRLLYLNIL